MKIAPDLADEDVLAIGELARDRGLDGLIATNTTISRDGLRTPADHVAALGAGGLSGPVLRRRSVEVLRLLRAQDPRITLISVGGVTSAQDLATGGAPVRTSCRPTPPSSTAARSGRAASRGRP